MTAVPRSQASGSQNGTQAGRDARTTPVKTLKALVAELYTEQHKTQNLLSSLSFALRSFNNLNQFLELIPLMAARVADAEGSALLRYHQDGQLHLEQMHCQGKGNRSCQDVRQALVSATRQIAMPVLQDGTAATLEADGNTAAAGSETNAAPFETQVRHYLGTDVALFSTPVLVQGVERGRLYVFSRDADYQWTAARQQLVQLVADQAAVAIANNDLTAEVSRKERLDRELELASDIQSHLLPREHPPIAGADIAATCETADRVGGDYYDFIPAHYDGQHACSRNEQGASASTQPWGIVIGDVMGKGVPAGLIATMMRGMLRVEIPNRHSPAQILEHLNCAMYEDLDSSSRFVTLFYSEYDPQSQTLSYSNAAHNPPLLWRAATGEIQTLDSEGALIGLDASSRYEDGQVQLAQGDTVVYYTDGLTDAVDPQGERFDDTNLQSAVRLACQQHASAQAILDAIFERVWRFIGSGNRNSDDMTAVVLKVGPIPS